MLHLAFSLDVLLHEEVLTVVDHIGELADPVAQDDDAGFLGELQVDFDMPVTVDEIVYVGMILDVLLRVEYEGLAVFTLVGVGPVGLVLHS